MPAGSPWTDGNGAADPLGDLAGHSVASLAEGLVAAGYSGSHAGPILRSFYGAGGRFPGSRSLRLPRGLEARLGAAAQLAMRPAVRQASQDGTVKLLLRLGDGRSVESVLMPGDRPDRAAGCVSSQVGCAMGCDFCATTRGGFERNLTVAEIVSQFLALRREALAAGRRLRTVVFMGMGEPLLNLDSVGGAVRRIAGNDLGGLGGAQVTVSTVGLVAGIDALSRMELGVALAISLHAPDDATRARLIPAARRQEVSAILAAADRFSASSGRPVTLQYCLLRGVNDSPGQAFELAALLHGRRMHVNLLRYNPTGPGLSGADYEASPDEAAQAFEAILRREGVVAHVRRPRGRDIDAACGQLRERRV